MKAHKIIQLLEVAASRWRQPLSSKVPTYEDALSLIEGRFVGRIDSIHSKSGRVWSTNTNVKPSEILQLSNDLGLTDKSSKTTYIADNENFTISVSIRNNLVSYIGLDRGRYQYY